MANSKMVKHKTTGALYEVQQVLEDGTLVCYKLSGYDGMPTGSLVHLRKDEVEK